MTSSEVATAEYTITEPAPAEYSAVVNNGAGGGSYVEGATVIIKADDPETGKQFKDWTTEDGVIFADASAPETTFSMPTRTIRMSARRR